MNRDGTGAALLEEMCLSLVVRRLEGNKRQDILRNKRICSEAHTDLDEPSIVLSFGRTVTKDWSYVRTRDGFSLTSVTFHFMTLNALGGSWLSTPTKSCPLYCWGSWVDMKTPLPFVRSHPTSVPALTVALSSILMSIVRDLTGESSLYVSILTRWYVHVGDGYRRAHLLRVFSAFYMWTNIFLQKIFDDVVLPLCYFFLAFCHKATVLELFRHGFPFCSR